MGWYEGTALAGALIGLGLGVVFAVPAVWAFVSYKKSAKGWKVVAGLVLTFLAIGNFATVIDPAQRYFDARQVSQSQALTQTPTTDTSDASLSTPTTDASDVSLSTTTAQHRDIRLVDPVPFRLSWWGPDLLDAQAAYCDTDRGKAGMALAGNAAHLIEFRNSDQTLLSRSTVVSLRILVKSGNGELDEADYDAAVAESATIEWIEGGVEGLEGTTEVRMCKMAYNQRDIEAFPSPSTTTTLVRNPAVNEPVGALTDAEKVWCETLRWQAAVTLAADTLDLLAFRTLDQISLSKATRAALESVVHTGNTGVGSAATDAANAEVRDIVWQGSAWNRSCKAAYEARP